MTPIDRPSLDGEKARAHRLPVPSQLTSQEIVMSHSPSADLSPPAAASSSKSSWWGDRGVSAKTLTAVGAAAAVAVGVGVMGLGSLSSAAEATQRMHDSNGMG